MSPDEDAALLLVIVRRHLAALRLSLDPSFPDEEWGFLAQQALEKILVPIHAVGRAAAPVHS
jgi:hypothetical protein